MTSDNIEKYRVGKKLKMKNVIGVRQAAADRGKRDGVIGYIF